MTVERTALGGLGYGCSNLMSRIGRKQSLRLLEIAWERGVRHFDTARLYGYGEAESVLGDFLKGKRDKATVATKFGINPPKRSPMLKAVKTVARGVVAVIPGLRKSFRSRAESMIRTGCFDLQTATLSLETSLRELKTDYLDFYLMHECRLEDVTPEIIEFLGRARMGGRIRRHGIATLASEVQRITATQPQVADVVQYPNSVWTPNSHQFHARSGQLTIHHSVIGRGLADSLTRLNADQRLRNEWEQSLGVDCTVAENLAGLALLWALHVNSSGLVLFASVDEVHIGKNCSFAVEPPFSQEQVKAFGELVLRQCAGSSALQSEAL